MTDAEIQGSYLRLELLGNKRQRHWKKEESTFKRDWELIVRSYFGRKADEEKVRL